MQTIAENIMHKNSSIQRFGLASLGAWWRTRRARIREREQIARLGRHEFADMGTTRAELEFELETPLMRRLRAWGF